MGINTETIESSLSMLGGSVVKGSWVGVGGENSGMTLRSRCDTNAMVIFR